MSRFPRIASNKPSPFQFSFRPAVQQLDDRIVPSFLTMLASQKTDGTQSDANSSQSVISGDGRYVVFTTTSKLVAEDTNAFTDVYRMDSATGTVALVSRGDGAGGTIGNGNSGIFTPDISADGRFVVFDSSATNLLAADADANFDVYVRDMVAGTTKLVSVDSAGVKGNASSGISSISADGKFISFASIATNLVAGDTNAATDIFRRDLTANTTVRISTDSAGGQTNAGGDSTNSAISADGRYIAFDSGATNLVLNDTNAKLDVFVKDTVTGTTTRVSVATGGTQADNHSGGAGLARLDISGDGKFVVYQSLATNLVIGDTNAVSDIFVRDLVADTTARLSTDATGIQGNAASVSPQISGNGRYIAFQSDATNLVTGDANAKTDIFVKDRVTGDIRRVSVSTAGTEGNDNSAAPAISRNGERVAFQSVATNLTAADANGKQDVFVNVRPLPALFVAGPSAGGSSQVRVFNPDGTEKFQFQAYPEAYTGGVFVATGDTTGDGVEDIVTSTGKGGSANIRVFDGTNGSLKQSFFAYPPAFTGGVNVAIGDVNNDGFADIVCGVGVGGGPNVRVLDGRQVSLGNFSLASVASGGALIASFFAYPEGFTGGVRVAVADVNGDGFADVICGVGSGGGPNVRTLDGQQLSKENYTLQPVAAGGVLINSFFALPSTFTGGVFIGTGDMNNDGSSDIIIGVESGGGPNVRSYDAETTAELASFFAFDAALTGGVRVAGTDINQDGFDDYVTGTGPGTGSLLRVFSGKAPATQLLPQFAPFGGFAGGVNVG